MTSGLNNFNWFMIGAYFISFVFLIMLDRYFVVSPQNYIWLLLGFSIILLYPGRKTVERKKR
jgi:hypothetical protein